MTYRWRAKKTDRHPTKLPLPHRGVKVFAFGLLGTVLPWSPVLFLLCNLSLRYFAELLMVVFFTPVLGIIAWVWGAHDMHEMGAGRMDASGFHLTNVGRILGVSAVLLWPIVAAVLCILGCAWLAESTI